MMPMGADFAYANARLNFANMDTLIHYFNSHYDNVTLLYSTPSEYVDALRA
jgi:lysosomal alpha-mannosidase